MPLARFAAAAVLAVASFATACSGSPMSPPTAPSSTPAPTTPSPQPQPQPPATARYTVIFDATWTAQTHPVDAPPDPHFSPLIGGTHNAQVAFWRDGAPASEGMRLMAERGRTSPLDDEIRAAIAAGTAQHVFTGPNASSPKTVSMEFDIGRDHPLVTLVTMVAPSPDWFAGVTGLSLVENGAWVTERVVPLYAWDAGTDSGATFTAPDQETVPRQPIARILTAPLAPGGQSAPLGTFTFRLLSTSTDAR